MRHLLNTIFMIMLISFSGCILRQKSTGCNIINDGNYDSEYPAVPVSESLEKILPSIKIITGLTNYKVYQFDFGQNVTLENIDEAVRNIAEENTYLIDRPSYGTGAIVYNDGRKMALLTCAHVVNAPDTQVTYYADVEGNKTNFIHSVNYKIDQRYTIAGYSYGNDLDIVAMDEKKDIALIAGNAITGFSLLKAPAIRASWGESSAMKWGSLVYIIGYPNGKKMLNQAVVSMGKDGAGQTFLVDKAMNRGISGSLVLAFRDGPPNLEIVGLIKAVPVKRQTILLPKRLINGTLVELNKPYQGDTYLGIHSTNIPGISIAVGIDAIRSFLIRSRPEQEAYGVPVRLE